MDRNKRKDTLLQMRNAQSEVTLRIRTRAYYSQCQINKANIVELYPKLEFMVLSACADRTMNSLFGQTLRSVTFCVLQSQIVITGFRDVCHIAANRRDG